jgi:hypothetical protein
MFSITWECTCFECGCPLNVMCTVKNENYRLFIRDFTTWVYLQPFKLTFNNFFYRSRHRVCISCFYFPMRIDPFKREIGTRQKLPRKLSKTFEEVYEYFKRFEEFRKRKDLEICIVEPEKRRCLSGLELIFDI